jgi:chemotaxis protein methyltransferase CheR
VTDELTRVAALVRRETGIRIQPSQRASLRASISRAAPGADPAAFLRLAVDPVSGPTAVGRLIDEVTVNETFFFREPGALETISWRLLLERAHARGAPVVRVWSAACSTGEEAYSLAILACEAFGAADPPVQILATDISTAVLARAWEGRYRERAVRTVEPDLRSRYFAQEGNEVVVGERPRRIVEFRRHNLARDPIPPLGEEPFDLVLCRNVLIYLDPEIVEHVIPALEQAARPDGMLILGSADTLCGTTRRLARLAQGGKPSARRGDGPETRTLRRPVGRAPRGATLENAVRAAGEGRTREALADTEALLALNPLDADALFLSGLVRLEAGEPAEAAESLRRALYVEPAFGLAAFQLGRAYDSLGDGPAARRAYGQALRSLEPGDGRREPFLGPIDLGDVAAACRTRLVALGVADRAGN